MLRYLLSGDMNAVILNLLVGLFVVFCTLPVHEYAHAWMAHKLGDDTAKWMGRLTLNPLKHIDPLGALMIVLVGIGWAKPVPINARNFKHYKRDTALTALAGPVSNIIMAFIYLLLSNAALYFGHVTVATLYSPFGLLFQFFQIAASINVTLAVFNLLPIPPLDGSRLFNAIFPDRIYFKIMQYENIIRMILFVALFTGILTVPISWLSGFVMKGISFLADLPFTLFF